MIMNEEEIYRLEYRLNSTFSQFDNIFVIFDP